MRSALALAAGRRSRVLLGHPKMGRIRMGSELTRQGQGAFGLLLGEPCWASKASRSCGTTAAHEGMNRQVVGL